MARQPIQPAVRNDRAPLFVEDQQVAFGLRQSLVAGAGEANVFPIDDDLYAAVMAGQGAEDPTVPSVDPLSTH